jgi:nicotinate-nucleotide pyrophosphorylase (carboxylating)
MVLDGARVRAGVRIALSEDLGAGDRTSRRLVPRSRCGRGTIVARETLIVAGLPLARLVFRLTDPGVRFRPLVREGARVRSGARLARVSGSAVSILAAERTALNYLQHLSGIATYTARCVRKARGRCLVRDTRKTTPGLRALEKYAVRVGGGVNHRLGLYDGVLIKRNHWRICGGVGEAVRSMLRTRGKGGAETQVEVSSLKQLQDALQGGARSVLLDNMSLGQLRRAIRLARGRAFTEISGGIREENLERFAALRPDSVSLGALTHSARWADISLILEPGP